MYICVCVCLHAQEFKTRIKLKCCIMYAWQTVIPFDSLNTNAKKIKK